MQILRAESLRQHNTLALEASANALVDVASDAEVTDALTWAQAEGLPVIPLGEGSNLVLAGDLEALLIRQRDDQLRVLAEQDDTVELRVSAGHNWHRLVCRTLEAGYYGLENLALIPGTAGAAPIQNIGAYGVELERFVRSVQGVDIASGEIFRLSAADCAFGYRDSIFKRELRDKIIITSLDLRLSRSPGVELGYPALRTELTQAGVVEPAPEDVFRAVVALRGRRLPDPATEPNAGSFFKNPVLAAGQAAALAELFPAMPLYPQLDGRVKLSAAWLIDQAGWKGQRKGGVGVHPGHALVLVNYAGGSGKELLSLAAEIAASVRQRFDVALEIEPRVYGR